MAKNIAEINAQNEQFLNAIVGEMTADGQEVIGEQGQPIENVEDVEFKLEVKLTNGETLVMGYSNNDMDALMSQLPGLEALLDHFKMLMTEIYEKGYSDKMETALDHDLASFNLPVDYNRMFPRSEGEENTVRLLFKLTDAINIWTTVIHALKEKQLLMGVFKLFSVQDVETKDVEEN